MSMMSLFTTYVKVLTILSERQGNTQTALGVFQKADLCPPMPKRMPRFTCQKTRGQQYLDTDNCCAYLNQVDHRGDTQKHLSPRVVLPK